MTRTNGQMVSVLNRFTSIGKLFELLSTQNIRMSDPKCWEDKNDVDLLEEYKAKVGIKSLYAICMTCESETIYHWGAFSEKVNACCIEFYPAKFLASISTDRWFRHGEVKYLKIKDLKSDLVDVKDIPFAKRYPYRNESEYRIIFESTRREKEKNIVIDLSFIKKITINQHLPQEVFGLIKNEIESKYGIPVNRSTVIRNDAWINHVRKMQSNKPIQTQTTPG